MNERQTWGKHYDMTWFFLVEISTTPTYCETVQRLETNIVLVGFF